MKRLILFCAPMGFMIWLVYKLVNRYITVIPDIVAIPMMIISVLLMMIGIVYHSWCFGKGKNPYNGKDIERSKDK